MLMYSQFNSTQFSNTYGYPNLAHPNTHFNITPFEAIYCDIYTYEHIKMLASVEENGYNDVYLVHTRNFIVNEEESDVVYLQNKTIGDNHTQMDPTYKYRAWYKAFTRIEIGHLVTPKTDPGNYIIEKTGDITVYAGQSVILKPGFHAQNGSTFHAFIKKDCKQPPENVPVYGYVPESDNSDLNKNQLAMNNDTEIMNDMFLVDKNDGILDSEQQISSQISSILTDSELPKKPTHDLPQQNFVARLDDE
jgi:hypothetical protein